MRTQSRSQAARAWWRCSTRGWSSRRRWSAWQDLKELRGVTVLADGTLRIGAMTRHREVAEISALAGPRDVLRQAAAAIANPTIRAMGTIGGSVALNDPGADYPPALFALSATMEIVGSSGTRHVGRRRLFPRLVHDRPGAGRSLSRPYTCRPSAGGGVYHKLARVAGDFAIVSVAITVQTGGRVRAVIGACGPRPLSLEEADVELERGNVAAAGTLLAEAADPVDDSRASAAYRRRIIPRMLARAFTEAGAQGRAS